MNRDYDTIIVGTGAAGLFCALSLPDNEKICIVTKQKADESDSFLAQGGICMLRGEEDYKNYYEDTMRAGHYENNKNAVELMIRASNDVIRELIRLGVRFDRTADGKLDFTREGAHSQPRILFHEDVTGKEITSTLLNLVLEKPNITIREYTVMIDIISKDNVCGGIVISNEEGRISCISAPNVVLACGGLGGLFSNSTNFPHITGDALAVALKHGISVEHIDYIQIHPTTLFSKKPGRRFLISESVRGEGALLYDINGSRFTDELQPRDLLTKAIIRQMEKDGSEFVWEDLRPLGREMITRHFPNIYSHCLKNGFNILKEAIPVVPAQHYFMGGIAVNLASQTSMSGLYAIGETSCNGVHGKNRLASNSLLESLVFARRAADDIIFGSPHNGCDTSQIDLSEYKNLKNIFFIYKNNVLAEIERTKTYNE